MVFRGFKSIALLVLITAICITVAQGETPLIKTYSFKTSDFSFNRDQGYDVIQFIKTLGQINDISKPSLPVRTLRLIVPTFSEVSSIEIAPLQEDTLPGVFEVFPGQPPRAFNVPPPPFSPPDSFVYNMPTPYPPVQGKYIHGGYLKEAHFVDVQLYPLRWIPRSKKLILARSIRITLGFRSSSAGPLVSLRRSEKSQFDFEQFLNRILDNPEDISKYLTKPPKLENGFSKGKSNEVRKPIITSLPSLEGNVVEYVIITNQACSTALQPLADWKTQKGLFSVIRSTEWIRDRFAGSDIQEKIRNFIKEAHIYWGTEYFLLGGDNDVVPGRRVWGIYPVGDYNNNDFLSDLYYAGLNGNWNADGDNIYGEISKNYSDPDPYPDTLDMDPDVWVGRIPMPDANTFSTIVTKILNYEKAADPLPLYLGKNLLASGRNESTNGFNLIYGIGGIPSNWVKWRLYTETPRDQEISVQNFKTNLGQSYGLISHHDHCGEYRMGSGTSLDPAAYIYRSDIEELVYNTYCSILMTSGCHPADFRCDCIAGRFLRVPNGGGVAFVGYSAMGWIGESGASNYGFHYGLFNYDVGLSQIYRLGMLTEYTRICTWTLYRFDHRYFALTLMGDPDLPVWTEDPKTPLSVAKPDLIPMGQQQFIVDVTYGPATVDSALVCLQKFNSSGQLEAYAYKYTGPPAEQPGRATFTYTPETEGEITVTVTGRKSDNHNFIPYEGTCTVARTPQAPYVFPAPAGRTYQDLPPDGNGDEKPNSGETLKLNVALTNSGDAVAQSVHAEISTIDMWNITILQAGADYGDIQVDQTVTNQTPFKLYIQPNCPDVHDAPIDITITDGQSHQWQDKFYITVLADSLMFIQHRRIPPLASGDFAIDSLAIWNRGSGAANDIVATLTCEEQPPYVEILQGTANFGAIPAGGTVTSLDAFSYRIGNPPPPSLHFHVSMQNKYGKIWEKPFSVGEANSPINVTPSASQTTCDLKWDRNSQDPVQRIIGYHVYRGDSPGGPYARVNTDLIPNNTYFRDINLSTYSNYFYRVTAIDTSLNASLMSDEVHVMTNYESKPNWPQRVHVNGVNGSSPAVGRIYPQGPMTPPGHQLVIAAGDSVYAWFSNGMPVYGWPIHVSGAGRIRTAPALGDMDNDGNEDIVLAVPSGATYTDIYIWDRYGNPFTNWGPKHVIDSVGDGSAPTLTDLNGDGNLDILLGTIRDNGAGGRVYAWDINGNNIGNWPVNTVDPVSGLVVGNTTGDWHVEVCASTSTAGGNHAAIYGWNWDGSPISGGLWPLESNLFVFSLLSLGDIDKDGLLEVVGVQTDANQNWNARSWDGLGNRELSILLYPLNISANSLSLGDIRNTGYLDIFYNDTWGGKLRAWDYQGSVLTQFSKNMVPMIYSCPLLGRFQGQGSGDVLVGQYNRTYGFDSDGQEILGWPLQDVGLCTITPCIADLDGDGLTEFIRGNQDGLVNVWNLGTPYVREYQDWPTFMHDNRRTGCYAQPVSGTLPSNTTWRGNIEMTGDVTVPQGVTLTIEPGTVIKVRPFMMGFRLNVYGTLNAMGTALDSIYFTSAGVTPQPMDWCGIDVVEGGSANLQYCAVRYGYNNITAESGSNVSATHCRTTKAGAAGVVLFNGAAHNVSDCDISDNGVYGINLWGPWSGGSTVMIERNILSQNGYYGIYAYDLALGDFHINTNTINYQMWEPPNPSLWGIYCEGVSNGTTLFANNISGYGQGGIQMYNSAPKCTCNTVSNTWNGLYFWNSTSVVTHNFVGVGVGIGAWVDGFFAVPNLGDKTNVIETDDGLNSIIGDSYHGVNNMFPPMFPVMAENNWWGNYPPDPPDPNKFIGFWDYDPWLLASPIPCGGPPGGGPQMGELLEQQLPRVFALAQSRPNPSSGGMVIHYQMPKACDVSIKVYNVSGQLVKTLGKGPQKAGYYAVSWNGRDETGHAVRSGVYFYKMEAGEFKAIRKLVLVR